MPHIAIKILPGSPGGEHLDRRARGDNSEGSMSPEQEFREKDGEHLGRLARGEIPR